MVKKEKLIKTFCQLNDQERRQIYEFVTELSDKNPFFDNYEEFIENYTAPVFAHGNEYFSSWVGGEVVATLACITKDVKQTDHAYITALYSSESNLDSFENLLTYGIEVCSQYCPETIRMGVRAANSYLVSVVQQCGFSLCDQAIRMRYVNDLGTFQAQQRDEISFVPLSLTNRDDFLEIHNRAFCNSPNGGQMTEEEMDNFLTERKDDPLVGICYYQGQPAAMYELEVREEASRKIGWIEGLGVHPDFQGKGLARMVLDHCIEQLSVEEIDDLKLIVIGSNERAYGLYLRYGFVVEEIISTIFEYHVAK